MNISAGAFLVFLAMLLVAAWRVPRVLFFVWPIALFVLPTTRTMVGGAPIYWYDAVAMVLLCRLYFAKDLESWPIDVPRWHRWFIGIGLVFGTITPVLRYGASLEMGWIFAHVSLAWLAFPIGIAVSTGPHASQYRTAVAWGLFIALGACAAIAALQFGNPSLAAVINSFYYQDMQGHLVLIEGMGARISASRVNGPHGDPNTFGGTTALVCALCLLLFRDRSKLTISSIVLAGIVVGATVSRQVLVAAVVGFGVAFVLGSAASRAKVIAAVCALGIVGIVSGVASSWTERLSRWEGGVGEDLNVIGRVVYGPQRLFAVIDADPSVLLTGVGLDVQKLVRKAADKQEDVGIYQMGFVSNSFLLALYYLGITGFILTLSFWIWTLRRALAMPIPQRALETGCVVTAMVLVASDNYAFIVEVSVAALFLLAAVAAVKFQADTTPAEFVIPVRRYENLIP
jgi:hypothetical protein